MSNRELNNDYNNGNLYSIDNTQNYYMKNRLLPNLEFKTQNSISPLRLRDRTSPNNINYIGFLGNENSSFESLRPYYSNPRIDEKFLNINSKRLLVDETKINKNVGPGSYQIEQSKAALVRPPSLKFSKAARDILNIQYNTRHQLKGDAYFRHHDTKSSLTNSPKASISKNFKRYTWVKRDPTPGPGAYKTEDDKLRFRTPDRMFNSKRTRFDSSYNGIPGPGEYDIKSTISTRKIVSDYISYHRLNILDIKRYKASNRSLSPLENAPEKKEKELDRTIDYGSLPSNKKAISRAEIVHHKNISKGLKYDNNNERPNPIQLPYLNSNNNHFSENDPKNNKETSIQHDNNSIISVNSNSYIDHNQKNFSGFDKLLTGVRPYEPIFRMYGQEKNPKA